MFNFFEAKKYLYLSIKLETLIDDFRNDYQNVDTVFPVNIFFVVRSRLFPMKNVLTRMFAYLK